MLLHKRKNVEKVLNFSSLKKNLIYFDYIFHFRHLI